MAYRKRKANGRFYVFLVLLAVIALGIFLIVRYRTGGTVEQGSLPLTKTASAVIVRDESLATAETYGNIKFLASEGEHVENGAKVAEVYKWGYNENFVQDLLTLQQEIRKYQVETILKDIVDNELNAIETSISQKADALADAVAGNSSEDVLVLQRDLERLMSDRSQLLRTKVQPDDKLTDMYQREDTLLQSIAALKGDALSIGAGLISFYFDGYESKLNGAKIDAITADDINAALKGAAKTTESDAQKPLYRIVNENKWYCTMIDPKSSEQKLIPGETYSIVFEGYFDRPYTGKLLSAREAGDSLIYSLEIAEDIGPFLSIRKSNATIVRTFDGLRIPTRALTTQDGKTGVFVHANGGKQFVEVVVLARSREYAIVRASDASSPLAVGVRVTAN